MPHSPRSLFVLPLALCALHCSRNASSTATAPNVQPEPSAHNAPPSAVANAPAAPAQGAAVAAAPPAAPAPAEPHGARSETQGDHYRLTVALEAPPAVPGASTLTLELRAGEGYHMNDLYPTSLALTASNATAPAQVRRNEGQITQELVSFRVPVQVASAGAIVRGTARFAVCSADTCVPASRDFAVNLP